MCKSHWISCCTLTRDYYRI